MRECTIEEMVHDVTYWEESLREGEADREKGEGGYIGGRKSEEEKRKGKNEDGR